ncbi:FecCD family ABC transporter permease [Agrobacterium genomosp. 13]|uniref:Iron ABC transporter, permease protein n=1 Tax=Agrobacterium genomosp. 13 str. CFBP 6927 TaxID=1183428 RepID=A0ABM9VK29_9HYPH|nr:iron ABC transporter permease [Agrobacterium genomosp. 13]CUX52432.1 Iron ABC transporter, permease protein [Agrobacterium genomosp. 13 str. CFBP 6927]
MTSKITLIFAAALLLVIILVINLVLMAADMPLAEIVATLLRGEAETYEQSVLLYQQIPRLLIAIYVGATTAVSGCVLQGLARNPLASPSTLGLNAGATLFVVSGALVFDFPSEVQGLVALFGAGFGFGACFLVARLAGRANDPRGLSLILSGALVSMLLIGMTNALLLSNPTRRAEFLSWVGGNINHVYAERLTDFWWIGAIALAMLWSVARPLTLVLLGTEKAASAGVNVTRISRVALFATMLASGSAVAICGPIGFVGLIVPHMVRPLVGVDFRLALPASALVGASLCILADLGAQTLFRPYVVNTGLFMDLLGGLVFIVIVKRFYLSPSARGLS